MKDQLSSKYLATWFTSDKWLIIKMVNKFFQSWIHAHTKLVPLRLSQPGHVEMLYGVLASETYKLLLKFQIFIPLDKRKETKYTLLTRKHSSRARTCLPTIDGHGTKCRYGWWGYQVSCWGGRWGSVRGCTARFNASWVMVTLTPLPLVDRRTDRHTRLKTLPSRNFVGGR